MPSDPVPFQTLRDEDLGAPLLAPRLGEHEGAIGRAGRLLLLLGQEAEQVDLGHALVVQVLLQLGRRVLLRFQRRLALPARGRV